MCKDDSKRKREKNKKRSKESNHLIKHPGKTCMPPRDQHINTKFFYFKRHIACTKATSKIDDYFCTRMCFNMVFYFCCLLFHAVRQLNANKFCIIFLYCISCFF